MKNSGIEWIGVIPEHWEMCRLKYLYKTVSGNGFNIDLQGEECGDYPFCKASDISIANKDLYKAQNYVTKHLVKLNRYNIIPTGSIIFAKIGEAMKKNNRAICQCDCCIDNNCQALIPLSNILSVFAFYILKCVDMRWFDNAGTIPCISVRKLMNSSIALPPLSEQKAIAGFLDKKCGEVDALIADIQQEIETLEQYKRSVITEAVTKGLDPSVPMKDSGAGWMPTVPAHWLVEKIKYHLHLKTQKNMSDRQVLSLYRDYGIVPKDSRDDNHNVTSEDTSSYRFVRVGDFVVNKMKAWQGSVAVSQYEGIVSPAYFVYEFIDESFDKKYFHYLLRNKSYTIEFMRLSGGIRVGQWDLPAEAFENTLVLIPPIEEQQQIADYLDKKCKEIEGVIADKQSQIETLESYKKSLIYEYVTGKKEVG